MNAREVMTTEVLTVTADTSVREIASLLLERRISAVPVVDADRRVVGIVSEGDLMRRAEAGTERSRSWWRELVSDANDLARDFVKAHGRRAADVMTRPVVSVAEDTSVAKVASLLESRRIKRVPVLRDGMLVGIVSRTDLLRALLARPAAGKTGPADDSALRKAVLSRLRDTSWAKGAMFNVVVSGGAIELLGFARSDAQRHAIRVLAENVAGGHAVHDRLKIMPRLNYGT